MMILKILAEILNSDESTHGNATDASIQTIIDPQEQTKAPSFYKVILVNDDYTPMDFVVSILIKFFQKTDLEATNIMLQVHQKGKGIAGVYAYEIAETKVFQVQNYAKMREFPLKITMEKE